MPKEGSCRRIAVDIEIAPRGNENKFLISCTNDLNKFMLHKLSRILEPREGK
jgi:hypothetical protein